jgi:DsbC/DsbD-like thiol-disulfide interchange protein
MFRRSPKWLVPTSLAMAGCLAAWAFLTSVHAQAAKSDAKVKITAKADKPGDDGKQTVTIRIEIEKGWHAYANPVGPEDFPGIPTTVTVSGAKKPQLVKIDYPRGKLVKDATSGDYFVYEDAAVIKATVQRARGDTGPLQINVKIQTCNENLCLQPAVVKVPVK